MGETREPEAMSAATTDMAGASTLPASGSASSILGQAPFRLDLRVSPRPGTIENGRSEHARLKPIERELLPELEPTPAPVAPAPAAPARMIPLPQQLTLAPIAPRVPAGDVAAQNADFATAMQAMPGAPKARSGRSRSAVGLLLKLAVLAGLIVGGVYAAKKYVLAPKWQEDVKVFADDVAERRGLEWHEAVQVEVLPRSEYSLRLAQSILGVEADGAAALGAEWRAMGVAEGTVDLAAIGTAAVADQPAFYDAGSGTIYQLDGLSPELRGVALSRALTMALLDQEFDWSDQAAPIEPGRAVAIRSLFDGDATALQAEATRGVLSDLAQIAQVSDELAALRRESAAAATSPYAVTLVGAAAATAPLFHSQITPAQRTSLEQVAILSDAAVFDGARPRSSTPVNLDIAGSKSVGMLYWYYALAGRIGSDAAWAAAVHWNGDATTVIQSANSVCVTSTIALVDQAGQLAMFGALGQWAQLAPIAASTTVSLVGDDRIDVRSCDPGASADTIRSTDLRTFGGAPYELGVVGAMLAGGLADTDEARACVVNSLRSGQAVPYEDPAGVDRALTSPIVDLTTPDAKVLMKTCATF